MEEDPVRPDVLRYWCQTHCDTFRMGSVFLRYVWPVVKAADKAAIAAYMEATKGPHRAAPLIQGDNYREYITHGRRLPPRVAAEPPSVIP